LPVSLLGSEETLVCEPQEQPTFIVSLSGLCGFILVVEDGEVDAYTPSGDLLGVFGDRVDAAEAVLRCGVHLGRLNH
jgi:hypothetical protein